ncbi:mannose-6-phosphate isomerase, class I [Citricoccus sp. GCM10030269]|uniref:mannose-6-phosphate isomerase, class I n=1 Tax=Citricoccus sp. GCM10030269 TaxID=3273388 RepID=UPI00361C6E57
MYLLRAAIRDYAWGSATLLAKLQGRVPTGRPEAEMWMGAHPGAPAGAVPVTDPQAEPVPLDALLERDPEAMLGEAARFGRLPYLVKLLAAGRPLSIQAHPTIEQAREGFAAEEAAGIPLTAPHRNYKDDNHKPEMIVALTPFTALCGFRSPEDAGTSFTRLAQVLTENADGDGSGPAAAAAAYAERLGADGLRQDDGAEREAAVSALESVFTELLDPAGDWASGDWVRAVVAAVKAAPQAMEDDLNLATAVGIAEHYPDDPGVLVSVLLDRVDLAPGQALHLPAGNVHAYVHGLGFEVMAASDNVLRGGLTPKHVDVPELRSVVRFEALPVPYCSPSSEGDGRLLFRPPFDEFQVERLDLPSADGQALTARGPVIAVCTAGSVRIDSGSESAVLAPGESVFIAASDADAVVHGDGHEPATLFSVTLP